MAPGDTTKRREVEMQPLIDAFRGAEEPAKKGVIFIYEYVLLRTRIHFDLDTPVAAYDNIVVDEKEGQRKLIRPLVNHVSLSRLGPVSLVITGVKTVAMMWRPRDQGLMETSRHTRYHHHHRHHHDCCRRSLSHRCRHNTHYHRLYR
ncbi:hypothetical protein E2C01_000549 [Portunus trituberculatus]|uniref:Uncharacterized protein n=1 Tax=Portunus trituberculatus TaxID=210409 RepID=A0A5B7CFF1_PORTR|nr:hypothetical protein [Portunus trituberculatus]